MAPILAKISGKLPMLRILFSFICMTVCFGLLYLGTLNASAEHMVNIYYVLIGVALIGIGEIAISPLTLALTTLLSPRRLLGVMMGLLMLAYSFASFANFILVKFVAVPKLDGSIKCCPIVGNIPRWVLENRLFQSICDCIRTCYHTVFA